MLRRLLLSVVVCLWAEAAFAVPPDDWVQPGTEFNTTATIPSQFKNVLQRVGGEIAFSFDDSWTTTTTFDVRSPKASCNLVQDQAAAGGTALVNLYACPGNPPTRTTTSCPILVKSFTDDDEQSITAGDYLIVNTAAAGAGDFALFSCTGYE